MFNRYHEILRQREAFGDEGGFTLIELLIVIVVLGILAAIVVFALGGVTGTSAVSACNSDAKTVSIAVSAEQAQNPNTPPTQGATGNLVTGVNGTTYLKSWPSNGSYYTIGIDNSGSATGPYNVNVSLVTGDPGIGVNSTGPNVPAAATPYDYEGSSPFKFTATSGNVTSGSNICQGV